MIELPIEIKVQYDADVILYKQQIEELKIKSIVAKKKLFSEEFKPFPNGGSTDDKVSFFIQFDDFLRDLTLFPDDAVLKKLRELSFAKHSLKWFVKLQDITNEIDRLSKIDGLYFLPNTYLFAVSSHLSHKFYISSLEGFDMSANYNNSETNIIFKNYAERYRRREYNEKRGQTPKMDYFEMMMHHQIDMIEKATDSDKGFAKRMMLKSAKGNTSFFYTLLNDFYCTGNSKNKIYLELFPLLKLIMKETDLLSNEEYFKEKDEKYDADYSKYKIARVKKILQKN